MKKIIISLFSILLICFTLISCGRGEEKQNPPKAETTPTVEDKIIVDEPKIDMVKSIEPVKATEPVKQATESKIEQPIKAIVKDELVFRINNGAEPESLDPAHIQGVPERRLFEAFFEGLISYDPETAEAIPALAESWTISEDGLTYTFNLRDALWSDGTPITANDVVFSWLRNLDPYTQSPYAWFACMFIAGAQEYHEGLEPASAVKIRALDDKTFQFDLIGPLPYVIEALGHYAFSVVPKHTIEQFGKSWTLPENFVCNGPFTLLEWIPQNSITCVKNENYWDKDAVKLDKVIFYPLDDQNIAHTMYSTGEIDWNTNLPQAQYDQIKDRPDYHVAPQLSTYYYAINNSRAPFDEPSVRKALSFAIDRTLLVESVTKAGQIPTWGIVPEMAGYEKLQPVGGKLFDVEKAQALLAEAGYPNGEGFPSFTILIDDNATHREIAEFIKGQWKENLNIDCTIVSKEWVDYLEAKDEGLFDIARTGWVGDYQDPNTFLNLFITSSKLNGGKYSNPTYDLFIREAAKMEAGEDRMGVLNTAEDFLINEDQGIIPLYNYVSQNIIDTEKWGGWYPNTMDCHPVKYIYAK